MIVVCTGSRTWTDESQIKEKLLELQGEFDSLTVVVGYDPHKKTPKGVDRMVYKWCKALGIHVVCEPADWNGKGYFNRGAGMERNILMLEKYEPNLVVAFRAKGKSNGTDHCITQARKRHIPVQLNHER